LPFLRVANVYANQLRLEEVKTIGVAESEIDRARLIAGDLLVVEGNGSIGQIGRVALWDGSIDECLHQNHLIKARFSPLELASWALYWLTSPLGRVAIEHAASSTSGLHTLSLSRVKRLPVPLAPFVEQSRIAAEVDRLATLATAAASAVAGNIRRCARLRQSILKWAFEGRLVDQDPTDEPASVLLARIEAERGAMTASKSTRRARNAPRRTKQGSRTARTSPRRSA
jgi:type I restriction enzyme S subunit